MTKKSLNDYQLKKHPTENLVELIDPNTGDTVGKFPWDQARAYEYFEHGAESYPLDNIKLKSPELNPDLQRQGLGEQVYQQIEKITGKKIIPDVELTESAANLHEKKGLGKSFGSSNYKPGIIQSVLDKLGDSPASRLRAEKIYNSMKDEIVGSGVPRFKAIGSILGKGLAAGAGGALSLGAEAADAESEGSAPEEAAMKRESDQAKFESAINKFRPDAAEKLREIPTVKAQDLLSEEQPQAKLHRLAKLLSR